MSFRGRRRLCALLLPRVLLSLPTIRVDGHEWHSISTGRTIPVLLVGNLVLLVGFVTLHGASYGNPTFLVIANLAMLIPTLACFGRRGVRGPRRAAAILLGLAMLCQAAGNVIFSAWTQYQAHPPVPSPSDIAYLGFYVVGRRRRGLAGAARHRLVPAGALARRRDRRRGRRVRARGGPELLRSRAQGDSAAVFVGAAYTVADLLLVAMIGGLLAVRGLRGGSIVGVAGRRDGDLLRGRRRLRHARQRGHLRRRDLAVPAVDDRHHLHRRLDLVAAAARAIGTARSTDDAGDPDAGDPDRGRRPCDLLRSATTRP